MKCDSIDVCAWILLRKQIQIVGFWWGGRAFGLSTCKIKWRLECFVLCFPLCLFGNDFFLKKNRGIKDQKHMINFQSNQRPRIGFNHLGCDICKLPGVTLMTLPNFDQQWQGRRDLKVRTWFFCTLQMKLQESS